CEEEECGEPSEVAAPAVVCPGEPGEMERSLKEAAAELKARVDAGHERRFPIMGLKGAANALMLRETAATMPRPLLVITGLASEAEAPAGEPSLFPGTPPER